MSEGMLGKLRLSEIQGPMSDLLEKLAGEDGPEQLINLKRFLRRENPWPPRVADVKDWYSTWRTVSIGGFDDESSFMLWLSGLDVEISYTAQSVMGNIRVQRRFCEMNLVRVTGYELGLRRTVGYSDVLQIARGFGLKVCPPEVGPLLRVKYTNQPSVETLQIAMDPVLDEDDIQPVMFNLYCIGTELVLGGVPVNKTRLWSPKTIWVFAVA